MNSLSWLLYAADLVGNLKVIMGLATIVSVIIIGLAIGVGSIKRAENSRYGDEDKDYVSGRMWQGWGLRRLWIPLLVGLVMCMIPSSKTIYMIAASEAGGRALDTPEFGKMRQLLNKYLDTALQPPKKDEDD